ncbi:Thiamine pyrophosphokinase [Psidium guajava]|nr:Thiamine pyrophosphokinase [Psidium guajava]
MRSNHAIIFESLLGCGPDDLAFGAEVRSFLFLKDIL